MLFRDKFNSLLNKIILSINELKTSNSRWAIAQQYEKDWWNRRNQTLDLEFYERFAKELLEFSKDYFTINENTKILEIGSGACGILTHIKNTQFRYAIDPLEHFYSTINNFTIKRDKSVKYFSAMGEAIPFKSNLFDLIIMDNVLDHCDNPEIVLKEIKRIIKKDGWIFFKQNTYHFWGKFIRTIMEKFLIDRGHPHTFTKNNLKLLLNKYGFIIIKSKRTGYLHSLKKEILSRSLLDKIKAGLLVTRDKVTYIIKNN